MKIEQNAREQLAEGLRASYPDDIARRHVIRQLLADELDLINARVAVRTLAAALTPPEGYVLVPVAVAKDADRYQWLRAKAGDSPEEFEVVADAAFAAHYGCPENLDINVDAAMLASRPEVLGG